MSTEVIPSENLPAASDSQQLMQMIGAAMRDDVDPDRLERMLAIKKEWEADEARKAYVRAMAAFKAENIEIIKDKTVSYSGTNYTHASIGNVVKVVCAGLGRHGFSHRWDTTQAGEMITVTCEIRHELGHAERTSLSAPPDDSGKKNRIQQVASTVSYLQRYTLLAATGLATSDQEDDDGRSSGHAEDDPAGDRLVINQWIQTIDKAGTVDQLVATRQSILDDYRGTSNVPDALRGALVRRKGELSGVAQQ